MPSRRKAQRRKAKERAAAAEAAPDQETEKADPPEKGGDSETRVLDDGDGESDADGSNGAERNAVVDVVMRACHGNAYMEDIGVLQEATEHNPDAYEKSSELTRIMLKNNLLRQHDDCDSPESEAEDTAEEAVLMNMRAGDKKKWKPTNPRTRRGVKAQERKHPDSGVRALEHTGILGQDLGGMLRLSKPRKTQNINELVWAESMVEARSRVIQEFQIDGEIEDYYATMCKVGQKLMAQEVNRKCQAIYDKKAGRIIYRANRRQDDDGVHAIESWTGSKETES